MYCIARYLGQETGQVVLLQLAAASIALAIVLMLTGLRIAMQLLKKAGSPQYDPTLDALTRENALLNNQNTELKELTQVALRTNEGMILCDNEGKIKWVNEAFQLISGYSLQECLGKRPHEVLHGPLTNKDTLAEIFNKLSNKEIFKGEILDYRKDGQPFWADISISPITENGQLSGSVSIIRDVTTERNNRQLIEASEWRHRLLFEDLPLPMMIIDAETTGIISANNAACRTYGYTKEEFMQLKLEDILVESERTKTPEFLQKFGSAPLVETTKPHKRKDGSVIQMETSSCLTEIDGRKVRLSLNKDVSRTVAVEKALSQSEERFASFMEYSPAVAWIKNNEGRYVYVNDAFSKKFSVTNEFALNKMDRDLLPQKYADEIDLYDKRVAQGESFELYSSIPTPDGVMRDWWIIKFPIKSSNGETFICGLAHDITDRRKAEKALEVSEKRYRLISENSRDLICLHDLDGTCNFISPSIQLLTGYTPKELLGRRLSEFVAADDIAAFKEFSEQVAAPGYTGNLLQYRFSKKDGTYIWLETSTQPILNEKEELIQVLSVSRDVTVRKETELELERYAHNLQHINEELQQAKEQAEKSAKIKEEFLANTSHEIRTPMNAILGLTRILLDSTVDEKQKEYLKAIETSGDTLLVVINDILDLSKIEAGKLSLEEIPFDLTESVHFACNLLKPKATEKNITLSCAIDKSLPTVLGDPVRLNQILLNIISNAIKFTHIGEVLVSINTLQQTDRECEVHFSISDTGIGIPEDQVNTIFQSFTQVSSSTARKYGGTGLGLAIVKRLIDLHGGSIQVESKINEGSIFTFNLKYKIPQEENKEVTLQPGVEKGSLLNKKGLLVEDNPINQMVAKRVLESFGMTVSCASSGEEALKKMDTEEYDIVFMDIQMPGLDGYQTTEHIRADNRNSQVPILAMTANATTGESEKCISFGMDGYISKPFDTDNLYNTILGLLYNNKEIFYEQ